MTVISQKEINESAFQLAEHIAGTIQPIAFSPGTFIRKEPKLNAREMIEGLKAAGLDPELAAQTGLTKAIGNIDFNKDKAKIAVELYDYMVNTNVTPEQLGKIREAVKTMPASDDEGKLGSSGKRTEQEQKANKAQQKALESPDLNADGKTSVAEVMKALNDAGVKEKSGTAPNAVKGGGRTIEL